MALKRIALRDFVIVRELELDLTWAIREASSAAKRSGCD